MIMDNNSIDFRNFKLHADSTLKGMSKDELISYIHMLYDNWECTDTFYENALKCNEELYKSKSKLLDDVHNYRYEYHCMKMTILNLCKHFNVKNEEELQQFYVK